MNCGSEEKFRKVLGSSFFVEKTRNEERPDSAGVSRRSGLAKGEALPHLPRLWRTSRVGEKTKNEEQRTKNNSGLTLIGIIAAIVVMGLLGAGVLMLVSIGSMESIQTLKWGQAFYAAESGVSAMKAYIATNGALPYTCSNVVGQASFMAIINADGGITSIGSKDEAQWTSMWRPTWHAMLVYGTKNNVGMPQYRIWDGDNSLWSSPSNALSVGSANINWVVVKACPERNEYVTATIDTAGSVRAQVWRNGIWTNLQTIATVPNADYRGMDVAYESLSGDAIVVAADGDAEPTYYVWNGSAWTGPGTINVSRAGIVNWVKLASDPVSDEIIVMVQDANQYYTAQVWNGSNAWGNEKLPATESPAVTYESMAVEYETSGGQAIIVSANATAPSFKWSSWNGTTWSSEGTTTIGNDFYWGTLVNDPNSDNLLLTYIDTDKDIGKVFWNGSAWTGFLELNTRGNSARDRCVQGQFETLSGHEGHALIPYSEKAVSLSRHAAVPSGDAWDAEISVSTIRGSATVQTRRTGDGKILAVFFNDVNSRYEFSWHDGTNWSAIETLETSSSVTAAPYKEPFMMAPQLWVLP